MVLTVVVCTIISYGSLEERNRFSFRMITFSGSNAIFVYHCLEFQDPFAKCLKITEKVSFNIASEASYAHILNGQK